MEDVTEEVRLETESIWSDIGVRICSRVAGNSLTLGLGFVVHLRMACCVMRLNQIST